MNRFPAGGGRFGGHPGGGVGWFEVLDSIALWILAIAAILLVVNAWQRSRRWKNRGAAAGGRFSGATPTGSQSHLAPIEGVLAERYARGEISGDEYQTRLAVLRGYPLPGAAATTAYPAAAPQPPVDPVDPAGQTGPTGPALAEPTDPADPAAS
jgi:putative membrane protein